MNTETAKITIALLAAIGAFYALANGHQIIVFALIAVIVIFVGPTLLKMKLGSLHTANNTTDESEDGGL